ncbi:MAG: hypothetical protein IT385_03535 [Deltaproteobacteria bacterium]|nr:hypothetical protein [Deltaproteobacteria bacterium]
MLVALALVVALGLAAPPSERPRPPAPPARDDGRDDGRDDDRAADRRRRAPEPSPAGPSLPLDVEERPLRIDLRGREIGCRAQGWERVRERLLGLENRSPLMSLELWGDKQVYEILDEVVFHLRAARGSYVSLWWLGPDGHVLVVLDNVRVPGERNVTIDTGGIIVPPLGVERWVGIATLEPVPVACRSEDAMLRSIERRLAVEHGVGRWDVISR